MAGYTLWDKKRSNDMRKLLRIFNINDKLTQYKIHWREYIQIMYNNRLPKKINYKPGLILCRQIRMSILRYYDGPKAYIIYNLNSNQNKKAIRRRIEADNGGYFLMPRYSPHN